MSYVTRRWHFLYVVVGAISEKLHQEFRVNMIFQWSMLTHLLPPPTPPRSLPNAVCSLLFKLESCGGWRGFSFYLSSPALPSLSVSLTVFSFFALLVLPDSSRALTDPWNDQYLCSPGTKRHRSSDREGSEFYIIPFATSADSMVQI